MIELTRIPKRFTSIGTQVLYSLMVPLFFVVFVLLYKPFHLQQYLEMGRGLFLFNVVMIGCIILVSTSITRTVFYFSFHRHRLDRGWYIFWCLCEAIIAGMFVSLYTWLMLAGSETFFSVMGATVMYIIFILVLPYVLIGLGLRVADKKQEPVHTDTNVSVKFLDTSGRLKLIVQLKDILYVEAKENYIVVNYMSNGVVMSFTVRNTMKSIESMNLGKTIIRCHRSFFVNSKMVRVLRKSEDGVVFAELKSPSPIKIPVTKTYYDQLAAVLE